MSLEIIITFFHVLICFLSLICQGFSAYVYKAPSQNNNFFVDKLVPKQTSFVLGKWTAFLLRPVLTCTFTTKGSFICMLNIIFYYCNYRFICISSLLIGDTSVRWATLCARSVVQSTWLTKLCPSIVVIWIIARCVYYTRQHLLHSIPQKRKTNWRQVT